MNNTDPLETITFAELVIKTAPVIVGGLLATFGAFMGTSYTQRLQKSKEEAALKLQKMEELLSAATACHHWLHTLQHDRFQGKMESDTISPLAKVKYLSAMYAPELKIEVSNLALAHANYVQLVTSCNVERLEIGAVPDRFLAELPEHTTAILETVSALVDKAVTLIEKKTTGYR